MLDTIDLNASVKKKDFERALEDLDTHLGEAQRSLRKSGVPMLIVFDGWDAAGKGTAIGKLAQAFDPRGFTVHHIHPVSEPESFYPPMHRFWTRLPIRGNIAIFNHSWYRQVLDEAVDKQRLVPQLRKAYERIRVFERQLMDDGAVIVKFFLHISKGEQSKRFKELARDPVYSWKVGEQEQQRRRQYDLYEGYIEEMFRETSTPQAPWIVVPATDKRYLSLKTAETVLAAMKQALANGKTKATPQIPHVDNSKTGSLDTVNLSLAVNKEEYNKKLPELQEELRRLQHICYLQRKPVAIVFEGWDAGGKGGAIRRLTWNLDPRGYAVIPFGAPEGEEAHKHYLWRFWLALQKAGHFTIFDRSWYGRVLVERVEGFATPEAWRRAYREINEFEADLLDSGMVLCKFWMHVSKDEQLRRFEARAKTPPKQWKITDEDWRNREKWDLYWEAVSDMLDQNSTSDAPWTIVEGDNKRHARLKVLAVTIERIRASLEIPAPRPFPDEKQPGK